LDPSNCEYRGPYLLHINSGSNAASKCLQLLWWQRAESEFFPPNCTKRGATLLTISPKWGWLSSRSAAAGPLTTFPRVPGSELSESVRGSNTASLSSRPLRKAGNSFSHSIRRPLLRRGKHARMKHQSFTKMGQKICRAVVPGIKVKFVRNALGLQLPIERLGSLF